MLLIDHTALKWFPTIHCLLSFRFCISYPLIVHSYVVVIVPTVNVDAIKVVDIDDVTIPNIDQLALPSIRHGNSHYSRYVKRSKYLISCVALSNFITV